MQKNQSLMILLHWTVAAVLLVLGAASTTVGAAEAQAQERLPFPLTDARHFTSAASALSHTAVKNSAPIDTRGNMITASAPMTVSPFILWLPLVSACPGGPIYGRVTYRGANVPGIELQLRFYNGTDWSALATTTTNSRGEYSFTEVPALKSGQIYYVRYSNPGDVDNVSVWQTRQVTSFSGCAPIAIGDFDIADVALTLPPLGALVPLPFTFYWNTRSATPTDIYDWNLFDPIDANPIWWTDPALGYAGSFRLDKLPSGFTTGTPYGWFIGVYSPDGGYGESYYYRDVTFSTAGSGASMLRLPPKPRPLYENHPVRPEKEK